MKRKITKAEFEALNEVLKGEYEEKNGAYYAKIEDDHDAITSIKQAKENEVNAHKETKKRLKEFEDKAKLAEDEHLRKSGDVKAIEESWSKKYSSREAELLSKIETFQTKTKNSVKDGAISKLAAKLCKPDAHRIFSKSVSDRFDVEIVDDNFNLRILDKDGKPSALSIEDFEKELLADKEFSAIIVRNQASGTVIPDSKNRPGRTADTDKPVNLATLSPSQLAERITASKTKE